MTPRLAVGLTGGIASGKSTVAQRFVELGVPVVDADEAARAVVARGTAGLAAVTTRFGSGILQSSGELDRRALRDRVFANPAERRDLEGILHPLIQSWMRQRLAAAAGPYVVVVIPLLVESDAAAAAGAVNGASGDASLPSAAAAKARLTARHGVQRILVVDIDEDTQLSRLMARDGGSESTARAILAAQAGREARLQRADDVLRNGGDVADLRQGVDRLHEQYLRIAGEMVP